jgi:alpha-glucosidase (family GH31 glycosyl hydrolase)
MRCLLLPIALTAAACTGTSTPDATGDANDVITTDAVDVIANDTGPSCTADVAPEPALPTRTPHTPRWVYEPWISKDISTTDDTYAFVQGFHDRDIPVGAVVLDSPWETQYHTFVPNPTRYHDFDRLVRDLHAQNVRIVLWMTQQVNVSSFDVETGGDIYHGASPNFLEGSHCGFYVDNGAIYQWWKGRGASIDFFDARARAWWHAQQDPLLAVGIDGWKLDFGDSYVPSDPVQTDMGPVPHQQYSEAYYRDYLEYGASRRGDDFITMVRAYDRSYNFAGRFYARPEHAPVAWMGDNRRDWIGLADALDHMFRSANAGYVVLGSDIGGYLDHDDQNLTGPQIPFSQTNFVRWVAVGALNPFMQLHGRANLTPWTVPDRPDETVTIYRYWATLHHELVPFFDSLAQHGYQSGPPFRSIMRPIGAEATWPNDYRYQLGDAFLVAPILDDTGIRDIALPSGASWFDWWAPSADPIAGGTTLAHVDSSDRSRIPVYVREGAIVPAEVSSPLTGIGAASASGALTLLVYPSATGSDFTVYEADANTTAVHAARLTDGIHIDLAPLRRRTILRVRVEAPAALATVDGTPLTPAADRASFDAGTGDFFYDTALRSAWVRIAAPTGAPAGTTSVVVAR